METYNRLPKDLQGIVNKFNGTLFDPSKLQDYIHLMNFTDSYTICTYLLYHARSGRYVCDFPLRYLFLDDERPLNENIKILDDYDLISSQEPIYIKCTDALKTTMLVRTLELKDVIIVSSIMGQIDYSGFLKINQNRSYYNEEGFMSHCDTLESVTFYMPWISSIGNEWLRSCTSLKSACFIGMTSLIDVGKRWMMSCTSIVDIKFMGMHRVKHVDSYWLSGSSNLRSVGFHGLDNLFRVGSFWLSGCKSLMDVNFRTLRSLRSIACQWMSQCSVLYRIQFDGLCSLQTVGTNWMSSCRRLKYPNFNGLQSLKQVGSQWMWNCSTLVSPQFHGLTKLIHIGHSWMSRCSHLESPNFVGLDSLKKVGHSWMSHCDSLVCPDFCGLVTLETISHSWMYNCKKFEFHPKYLVPMLSLVHLGPDSISSHLTWS